MEAPKKFNDNPTAATSLVKNGTEFIGIDQGGVAKKIPAETLMTKANVGLGNVDNVSDVDKPVSDAQALINDAIKGVGWTDENLKQIADELSVASDDIDTLNADVTTPGSVLKSIKDNAEGATFTPVGGISAETIGGALGELDSEKESIVNVNTLKGVGWVDETVKDNADAIQSHKLAIMPHQFQDLLTGKTYKYGFQLSAEGNPQTIYEEVV